MLSVLSWHVFHSFLLSYSLTLLLNLHISLSLSLSQVGHGICQDAVKLLMAYHLEVYCFHDVFLLSTHLDGLKQLSLDGLVRLFLHKRLLKEQALTDWGKPLLAYNQMEYSANSAFAALTMYKIITG